MNDSPGPKNAPEVRANTTPATRTNGSVDSRTNGSVNLRTNGSVDLRTNNSVSLHSEHSAAVTSSGRTLTVGALSAIVAAGVVLVVFKSVLLAGLLAVIAVALFGMRQLIQKSVAATADNEAFVIHSTVGRIEEVRKQVSKCKYLENIETEGTEAATQAQVLSHQYKDLRTMLGQKFDPNELTYDRYLGSIDETCLAIGDNLLYIKNRLENLNLTKSQEPSWLEQQSEVRAALAANKGALAELAGLFNSLNEITTKETHRDQLESSMEQIRALAERAKNYSKN